MRLRNSWSGGLATWTAGNTLYLSVVMTWRIDEAVSLATFASVSSGRREAPAGMAAMLWLAYAVQLRLSQGRPACSPGCAPASGSRCVLAPQRPLAQPAEEQAGPATPTFPAAGAPDAGMMAGLSSPAEVNGGGLCGASGCGRWKA